MAKGLRGKSTNFVVWIILGLLVVGLTGFGIGNYGSSLRTIGHVGDEEITVQEYSRAITSELRGLQARTGQSLSFSQAQAFGLDRMVLQNLVSEAALDNAARKIGLSVGDAEVRRQLLQIDAFKGLDGRFNDTSYRYALEQSNLRPNEFDDQLRADRARGLLQAAVAGGVRSGGTWTEAVLAFVGESRSFAWVKLSPDILDGPTPAPTDAEVAAFYEANPALFTAPEIRRITYAWLTPDMLLDTIEVDEAALRQLYDERAAQYDQPERRLVERLVLPTAEDAAAAAAALADGSTTFDDLVASRGLSLEDVDLGEVARTDLPAAAAEAAFALTEPGTTPPVETDLGPAIYRVNAILEAQVTSFEDAREELVAEYAADRARRAIDSDLEKFDDLLASGATLEDLANETEMELGRIDWTAGADEGIAGYESFRAAARTTQPGDYPAMIELSDGGLFALRIDTVVPPALRPLDEVRDEVVAAWQQGRTDDRLAELATGYKARLEAGESFADLGLNPVLEENMQRDGFIEGAPEGLARAIFDLAPKGVAQVAGDGGVWLAQLTAITPYDPANAQTVILRNALQAQTSNAIANDIISLYTQAEQDAAGLTLDQSAVAAVNAQFP